MPVGCRKRKRRANSGGTYSLARASGVPPIAEVVEAVNHPDRGIFVYPMTSQRACRGCFTSDNCRSQKQFTAVQARNGLGSEPCRCRLPNGADRSRNGGIVAIVERLLALQGAGAAQA